MEEAKFICLVVGGMGLTWGLNKLIQWFHQPEVRTINMCRDVTNGGLIGPDNSRSHLHNYQPKVHLNSESNEQTFDNDRSCQLNGHRIIIRCHGVTKGDIIGPDRSRLKNINRVLGGEILKRDYIEEGFARGEIIIRVDKLSTEHASTTHQLILAFLRGRHYRQQARKFDEEREKWRAQSNKAHKEGNPEESRRCSEMKTRFGRLMTRCNNIAREAIFGMYNKERGLEEIDLHELYVADAAQLKAYYQQELVRHDKRTAEEKMENARAEQDEAIEKLREQLQKIKGACATEKPRWLEVIVGAGNNSQGEQKIKPRVENFLRKMERKENLPRFQHINAGSLLVTFKPYRGEKRCCGYYYCMECKKSWSSQNSWVGKYQCCYRCHEKDKRSECYPMKQSELRRDGHRRRNITTGSSIPPHRELRELCEKCIELGRYCGL